MIKRENKLVITFQTTTMAMAMESMCKKEGAPGRLIPVPKKISAGCGMAWCANPDQQDYLCQLMEEKGVTYQEIHICMV